MGTPRGRRWGCEHVIARHGRPFSGALCRRCARHFSSSWKTSSRDHVSPDTDWVAMCGTNAGSQLKLISGVDVGRSTGGSGNCALRINSGGYGFYKSDFAVAEVIVWPRGLTADEMQTLSALRDACTDEERSDPGNACPTPQQQRRRRRSK